MRTVRLIAETRGGLAVDFLPFAIADASLTFGTPSSTTPGTLAYFATPGPPYGIAYCVSREMLISLFGRQRKWRFNLDSIVTYQDYSLATHTHGFTISVDPYLDVVNTTANERFLPHARVLFGDGAETYNDGTNTVIIGGSFDFPKRHLNPATDMEPGNSPLPLGLWDTFSGNTWVPSVSYYPSYDAFYVALQMRVDVHVAVGSGDPTDDYTLSWNNDTINGTGTPGGSARFGTINTGFVGGHFYGDARYPLASFTVDTMQSIRTQFNGFFEFRDADGLNPIWHKDTGAKLIDPVPLVMP